MTTVVTDNCLKCKFTECVSSCPVSAFRAGEEMLYIDPDVCIDCGACISKCPVKAIYEDLDLPDNLSHWVDTNASESKKWPKITAKLAPFEGANDRKAALGF
jgi:ferredoxin